jgi:hypothetical protein
MVFPALIGKDVLEKISIVVTDKDSQEITQLSSTSPTYTNLDAHGISSTDAGGKNKCSSGWAFPQERVSPCQRQKMEESTAMN